MTSTLAAQQAVISFEDDTFQSLTQPWVVRVGGLEVARSSTYMGCYRFICCKGFTLVEESTLEEDLATEGGLPIDQPYQEEFDFAGEDLDDDLAVHGEESIIPESPFEPTLDEDLVATSKIEVDSVADADFGDLYRVWESYHFLGSFYQTGRGWIAQPVNRGPYRFDTPDEAQSYIVVASRAPELVTL